MHWRVIRQFMALLSLSYISMLLSLATWVVLPAVIGWTPTIVMSGSMEPNIMTGDVVIAQPVDEDMKKTIVPGQVLLAKDPSHKEKLVTHRVVNVIENQGFITKGDANAKADPTIIPVENVQGLERLRVPMIGLPLQALRTENYSFFTGFIAVTLLAQTITWREWKLQKKKQLSRRVEQQVLNSVKNEKKLSRMMVWTNVVLIASSPFLVSSDALFSGGAANASNVFTASTNFLSDIYSKVILGDSPTSYYRMNETSGVVAVNSAPNGSTAAYTPNGVTYRATGAIRNDASNTAVTFSATQGQLSETTSMIGPQSFTTEAWFKTTTTSGGQILGFHYGPSQSLIANRVIYMGNKGNIYFGVDDTTKETIETPLTYNDGKWHLVTATFSGFNAGLYIDGQVVASGKMSSIPASSNGFWIVSSDSKLAGWTKQPNSRFAGSIDEVAIYSKALSASQILNHYTAAG